MRSIVYRFDRWEAFHAALAGEDAELSIPDEEPLESEGGPVSSRASVAWVLAVFEIDGGRFGTASAARLVIRDGLPKLAFEERDWERLQAFGEGELPDAPPTDRTLDDLDDAPPTERISRTAIQGARLLLVDEDAAFREMMITMLEAIGFSARAVGSAEEAIPLLTRESVDLVVLDWILPQMSGIELCRSIRRRSDLAHVPILFLSAHSSSSDVVLAFAAGADDYVSKPFRAAELGARLFGLLRRAKSNVPASER